MSPRVARSSANRRCVAKCTLRACGTTVPRNGLRRSAGACAPAYVTRLARFLPFLPQRGRTCGVFDYSSSTVSPLPRVVPMAASQRCHVHACAVAQPCVSSVDRRSPTSSCTPPTTAGVVCFFFPAREALVNVRNVPYRWTFLPVSPVSLEVEKECFRCQGMTRVFLPALISDLGSRCRPRFS